MEKVHKRIIEESLVMFFKYGIRSVTMDDVAREVGVSKKTLYNHVKNKADLVSQAVELKYAQVTEDLETVAKNSENAIDELFAFDQYLDEVIFNSGQAVLFQLKKYYPAVFVNLNKRKSEFILSTAHQNLKKGIAEGLYRNDLHIEYIGYIYMAHAEMVEGLGNVPEEICHSHEFHKHHLEYHIRGIATQKGLNYLQNKLQKWI